MAMLNDAKLALRLGAATTAFDTEITDLIAAARLDLAESGVDDEIVTSDTDALIKRAIITYVKANFGWDNPDADRLKLSYDLQAQKLSLTADYREED